MFALAWSIFSLFLAATIWRTSKAHSQPELGFSTTHNNREAFFSRFVRKMSFTAVVLCIVSAILIWSNPFLAVISLLAIPAVAALQIYRGKRAIEAGRNRSLPVR